MLQITLPPTTSRAMPAAGLDDSPPAEGEAFALGEEGEIEVEAEVDPAALLALPAAVPVLAVPAAEGEMAVPALTAVAGAASPQPQAAEEAEEAPEAPLSGAELRLRALIAPEATVASGAASVTDAAAASEESFEVSVISRGEDIEADSALVDAPATADSTPDVAEAAPADAPSDSGEQAGGGAAEGRTPQRGEAMAAPESGLRFEAQAAAPSQRAEAAAAAQRSAAPPVTAQITAAVAQADQPVTELRLSPDELGAVRIELRGEADRLHVAVSAERPETLDLLRRNAAQLAEDLRAAGFVEVDLGFGRWTGEQQEETAPAFTAGAEAPETVPLPVLPAVAPAGLYLRI